MRSALLEQFPSDAVEGLLVGGEPARDLPMIKRSILTVALFCGCVALTGCQSQKLASGEKKKSAEAETYTLHTFKKIQLSEHFWSEGANYGDFNHDGMLDGAIVVAGNLPLTSVFMPGAPYALIRYFETDIPYDGHMIGKLPGDHHGKTEPPRITIVSPPSDVATGMHAGNR